MHELPAGQATPQEPQLLSSVPSLTHTVPQRVVPAGHAFSHEPPVQAVPAGHTIPQEPQLFGSVFSLTHTPPHRVSPAGHPL